MTKKSILVIGASGYVGAELTKSLLNSGFVVQGTFLHKKENIPEGAEKRKLDLLSSDSIENCVRDLISNNVKLDGLVFCHEGKIDLFKESETNFFNRKLHEELVQLHQMGPLELIEKLQLLFTPEAPVNIIFVGSLTGLKAVKSPPIYGSVKGAVRGLVDSLSKRLGEKNILVNSVDPGILEGGASRYVPHDAKEDYLKHCSLKRFGTNRDVANVIHWFLEENSYITGKSHLLDGGL